MNFLNKKYVVMSILGGYVGLTLIAALLAQDFSISNSLFFLISSLLFAFGASLGKIEYLKSALFISLVLSSVVVLHCIALNSLIYRDIAVFWGYSVAIVNLFLIIVAFAKGFLRTCFTLVVGCALFFVPLLFWGYYFAEGSFFNTDAFIAITQTNPRESYEYFISHFNFKILLALLAFVFILYTVHRLTSKVYFQKGISVGLAFFTILNIGLFYRTSDNFITKIKYKIDDYRGFVEGIKQRKEYFNTLRIDKNGAPGLYVLVIGESENKTHMGAYGYERNTTPWLNSMKESPNTVIFENAYSCHVQTLQALSYALTAMNQYNSIESNDAVSLIEMANAAGYDTYWISNQNFFGESETPISIIADAAKSQYFVNGSTKYEIYDNHYDEDILTYLDGITFGDKALVIIHLMGNHWFYSERYPKDFDKYGEGTINSYDNSILYNDHVMERIYKKLSANHNFKALVYFSDHSEGVNYGLQHGSSNFIFDMTYIPFYMCFSKSYTEENSDIFNRLKSRQKTMFTNDLIFNTMLSVMNIKIDNIYEPENDFAGDSYNGDTSRFKTVYGKRSISEDTK